jgi:uncharacterized protein (TIGR02145 family)
MKTLFYSLFIGMFLLSCGTENKPTFILSTTVSPSEGGTITPPTGEYSEGEIISLEAIPTSSGWRFVRWEGDWTGDVNPVNIGMTRSYNIIGVFERRNYFLSITIEGEGTVEERIVLQKSTEYPYQTVVELTPVPSEGWTFVEWGGDLSGSEVPQLVTVSDEKNVTVTFEIVLKEGDVYNPVTGRVWMDRNLGASRAATSSTDDQAYGDLYQWGRSADGHQKRTSPTTTTRSSGDQPGHGSFIISSGDWRSPRNDNLWQGVNGINNPCPVGYRLPTEAEWNAERGSWSSNDSAGAIASPLKLTLAGYRNSSSGERETVGSVGNYWSSSVSGIYARYLIFSSSYAAMYSLSRADGYSVRCIKD